MIGSPQASNDKTSRLAFLFTARALMGIFSRQTREERYYPRPISEVFEALATAIERSGYSTYTIDDLSSAVSLRVGAGLTTWGETLTASCHPNGDGTDLRVAITRTGFPTISRSGHSQRLTEGLLQQVTHQLR